jgi:predicted metal-binding membrane protein
MSAHKQRLRVPLRVTTTLRWRPDWPFAVIVAAAWIALLTGPSWHANHGHTSHEVTTLERPAHEHHNVHGSATPPVSPAPEHDPHSGSRPAELLDWTVMSVAMMVPVVLPAVRHVGLNSIRSRRRRAMSTFFTVYVGIWIAFGIAASAGERLAHDALGIDDRALLTVVLAVAAGWQLTRIKRRALNGCRRTVALPPVGVRAHIACAHFAFRQGWRCVTSCWPLMAVMTVVEHSALLWMIALTTVIAAEELTVFGRRRLRLTAVALSVATGLVALGT